MLAMAVIKLNYKYYTCTQYLGGWGGGGWGVGGMRFNLFNEILLHYTSAIVFSLFKDFFIISLSTFVR